MTLLWSALHARLHQTLRSRVLCPSGQRILVAVSGGQDSLCLLRWLLDLQPKWAWSLAMAHCNHRWRSDADANADYVEQLAHDWQVPYYSRTVAEGDRPTIATEAGARTWRYQMLTEMAIAHGYDIVTTGHTASDRAETLLYNLMRGSGTDGLQALTWQRPLHPTVQLVRPLLNFTRTETAQGCQQAHIQPWVDSSNDDWRYARNRIRQDLLPYLKTHFNPNVEQALAQTAEILQGDLAYLEAETDTLWNQAIAPHRAQDNDFPSSGSLSINRRCLATAPLALQRRVMRRCLIQTLPKAPNFEHIAKLTALITAPNRSQTDPFPGGAIARVDGDWIVLEKPLEAEKDGACFHPK